MSHAIKTLPDIVVTNIASGVIAQNNAGGKGSTHKWHSVTIQNNGTTGNLYVGDSLVSPTRKAAQLAPGQSYAIIGSAVDPSLIFLVADTTATASISGT